MCAVTADLNRELENWAKKADPTSLRALFPDGAVPATGDTRGSSRTWPSCSTGWRTKGPGRSITATSRGRSCGRCGRTEESSAEEDFERYRPEVVAAAGDRLSRIPGADTAAAVGGADEPADPQDTRTFDLAELAAWGTEYFHLFAEAAKQAWQDRALPGGRRFDPRRACSRRRRRPQPLASGRAGAPTRDTPSTW